MRIAVDELENLLSTIFEAAGMRPEDAEIVADGLTWAEMRGQVGHGVSRVPLYLRWISEGVLDVAAKPLIERTAASTFRVDGQRSCGISTLRESIVYGQRLAREQGAAIGTVGHMSHSGAIGRQAQLAAEQGFVSLIAVSGPPLMAYHGSREAVLGTNPIAIAVPAGADHPPILLDMATSAAAFGQILSARKRGATIPEGWALDAMGQVTTDPHLASALLPIAGPKGSGLALMFECLAGILGGFPIVADVVENGREQAMKAGMQSCFIAIVDITAFRPLERFCADAEHLAKVLRGMEARPGFDGMFLPGDRGAEREETARSTGVDIPDMLWTGEIGPAAAALGVSMLAGPVTS